MNHLIQFHYSPANNSNGKSSAPNKLNEKLNYFKSLVKREDLGFFDSCENESLINESKAVYQKLIKRSTPVKHFVHIGIGGSSLGSEMLIEALGAKSNIDFTFINNIDPDQLSLQLNRLNPQNCLFYFVSKSGGTAETMAALAIISSWLESKAQIGPKEWPQYFVVSTDPVKSQLKDFAENFHLEKLTIPSNIGGRFSVLTSVGYFPALFAGLNIDELALGAKKIKKDLLCDDLTKNPLINSCEFIYDFSLKGVTQTVLMPYSSKLRTLSFWFVQLWAESLGKKKTFKGTLSNQGLTPIPAYGATDQHSQVQLFMEGPYDKMMVVIEVEQFSQDFSLKNSFPQDSLKKLAPYTLGQLMKAEMFGTLKALESNNRPYIHLSIPQINESTIGALILYFESLTALMGHYLDVDPFDQPGVEAGKIFAFEWLKINS